MMMFMQLNLAAGGFFVRLMIVRIGHRPAARRKRRRGGQPDDEQPTERANRSVHGQRQIYHKLRCAIGAVVMVEQEAVWNVTWCVE